MDRSARYSLGDPNKLKVLLVVSSYLPNIGGLQRVTSRLARELSSRGHRVTLITQKQPRKLPSTELIDDIPVRRMFFLTPRLRALSNKRVDLFLAGLFYFPVSLAALVLHIRREKPDIVNFHFLGAPAVFLLVAQRLLRFRLLVSLHGDDVEGLTRGTWFDRWVFSELLRRSDSVTACSQYLLSQAQMIEPAIAGKSRVIHNGEDYTDVGVKPVDSQKLIVAVGRLVAKKGFDVLLCALARSRMAAQGVRLMLIGDGPERSRLESLSKDLALDGCVEFFGAATKREVAAAMSVSSVVAIPSRLEPFGIVALEAMAAGKPVIASDVGGLPEVLDGADALIVEPDNPQALAAAIKQLWHRLEVEPTFGSRNYRVAARFSVAKMTGEYLEVYQSKPEQRY